ncbi:MAG: hypothetical protein Q9163_000241 [Psora crenata]
MSWDLPRFSETSLPEHCTPTSEYLGNLSSALHSCLPTSLALLSTSLGILSIIAWLFAQLPQIYKNYKLKSASGLSIYFLTEWLCGDVTNLLGALFTGQAKWQVGIAIYYVIVDVCLTSQYFWYTHVSRWERRGYWLHSPDGDGRHGGSTEVLLAVDPAADEIDIEVNPASRDPGESKAHGPPGSGSRRQKLHAPISDPILGEKHKKGHARRSFTYPLSNNAARMSTKAFIISLLCITATASPIRHPHIHQHTHSHPMQVSSHIELLGRIFSWLSTLLYLGSRLPQIYKNAIRRSTSGLSPYMFLAAFCGNFFYSSAMIANPLAWASYPPYGAHGWAGPEGSDRFAWISLAAPFWLGAAGVLALDATVGMQFFIYGDSRQVEVLIEDRKGRSRWRRVTGWMRGWIPSPSPSGHIHGTGEERRPLISRRASPSGQYDSP